MDVIFKYIDIQMETYQTHKLWNLLSADCRSVASPIQLLQQFAPAIGYFILSFRDINEFVLPYENPTDELQVAINNHAIEDSTHYRLFLEDWEKLGGDQLLNMYDHLIPVPNTKEDHRNITKQTYNDIIKQQQQHKSHTHESSTEGVSPSLRVLSFLCSDANRHNRKLLFEFTKLVNLIDDPIVRFAIIEAVEQTGLIMFTVTSTLVKEILLRRSREEKLRENELQSQSQVKEYRYFGEYHLALETGHLINQDTTTSENEGEQQTISCKKEEKQKTSFSCDCEADAPFKKLSLDERQHTQCVKAVDEVFIMFTEWLDGIYTLMINQ